MAPDVRLEVALLVRSAALVIAAVGPNRAAVGWFAAAFKGLGVGREWVDAQGGKAPPVDPGASEARRFEAVGRVFRALSESSRTALPERERATLVLVTAQQAVHEAGLCGGECGDDS